MNPGKKGICFAQPTKSKKLDNERFSLVDGTTQPKIAGPSHPDHDSLKSPADQPSSLGFKENPFDKDFSRPTFTLNPAEKKSLDTLKNILRERVRETTEKGAQVDAESDSEPNPYPVQLQRQITPSTVPSNPVSTQPLMVTESVTFGSNAIMPNQPSTYSSQESTKSKADPADLLPKGPYQDQVPKLKQAMRYNSHIKNFITPDSRLLQQQHNAKTAGAHQRSISQNPEYYRNRGIFMNLEQLTQTNNLRFLQQMEFLRLNKFKEANQMQNRVVSRNDEFQNAFKKLSQNTANGPNYQSLARSIR